MSSEGIPNGFDPQQEEIEWVIRKDGEPLDVHIRRDNEGEIAASEFVLFSQDREALFKVSFPGELPSDFERRLSAVGNFIGDIIERPENYRKFELPEDLLTDSSDADPQGEGEK